MSQAVLCISSQHRSPTPHRGKTTPFALVFHCLLKSREFQILCVKHRKRSRQEECHKSRRLSASWPQNSKTRLPSLRPRGRAGRFLRRSSEAPPSAAAEQRRTRPTPTPMTPAARRQGRRSAASSHGTATAPTAAEPPMATATAEQVPPSTPRRGAGPRAAGATTRWPRCAVQRFLRHRLRRRRFYPRRRPRWCRRCGLPRPRWRCARRRKRQPWRPRSRIQSKNVKKNGCSNIGSSSSNRRCCSKNVDSSAAPFCRSSSPPKHARARRRSHRHAAHQHQHQPPRQQRQPQGQRPRQRQRHRRRLLRCPPAAARTRRR